MSIVKEQKSTARASRRKHREPVDKANWAGHDGQRLLEFIAIICESGGAIRLGYTRDGGAYAVGIYGDGSVPYTDYIRPGQDVEGYFHDLAEDFQDGGNGTK